MRRKPSDEVGVGAFERDRKTAAVVALQRREPGAVASEPPGIGGARNDRFVVIFGCRAVRCTARSGFGLGGKRKVEPETQAAYEPE